MSTTKNILFELKIHKKHLFCGFKLENCKFINKFAGNKSADKLAGYIICAANIIYN